MSAKQEKALRRALRIVAKMNAAGVTDRDAVAERIGMEEQLRSEANVRRKAERRRARFSRLVSDFVRRRPAIAEIVSPNNPLLAALNRGRP